MEEKNKEEKIEKENVDGTEKEEKAEENIEKTTGKIGTEEEKTDKSAPEAKKEEKIEKQDVKKKEKAVVHGNDLPISTKFSIAICDFIRKKKIEEAIEKLEKVARKEKAIPMTGEYAHRKSGEIDDKKKSGRFPVKTVKMFINLLKSLNANCSVNLIDNPYICVAKANKASQPFRRFGNKRFKRTHVYLEASELQESKILESSQNSERILKSKDSDSSQKSKKISDTRERQEKKIENKQEEKK